MSERFAHVCQDGHQAIGHNHSESELCPLCRINSKEGELSALRSAIVEQTGLIKGLSERLGEIGNNLKHLTKATQHIVAASVARAAAEKLTPQQPALMDGQETHYGSYMRLMKSFEDRLMEAMNYFTGFAAKETDKYAALAERLGEIEKLHKADFNFRGVILDQLQYDAISNQLRPQRPAKRKKGRK